MPSSYYPVFLDLREKNVLVIGGGKVAARKVGAAIRCGAKVTVVSTKLHSSIRRESDRGNVRLFPRKFRPEDLERRDLVLCATDDEKLNAGVGAECNRRKIWANIADRPASCSFILPSVVRRGDVTFAISTGGASPAFAKFLRRKVEKIFGREIAALAALLKKFRGSILKLPLKERKKMIARLVNDKTLSVLRRRARKNMERDLDGLWKR